jgi:poly-gamma-glutamate capsule biosynthesis protein CapA/YwtB (metallophosphatase superfamily)
MAHCRKLSLFLAGDAVLTRPWSNIHDTAFLSLIETIRAADVAIANLETVIHEFKGHAQADAGGTYMTSAPQIAAELKWAGFNMLAHANNHAFDYGASGVLETREHAEREGLILAGSGRDLESARAPRFFQCGGGRVALVASASDFIAYGKASSSRPDVHGRPGVNPLTVVPKRRIHFRPITAAKRLHSFARRLGLNSEFKEDTLSLEFGLSWGRRATETDLKANLEAISEASSADAAIVSIHSHLQGQWLRHFAHRAIERGARVVHIHGPHHIRGIELYRGNPIFYSMGNFAFEPECVTRFPAEAYEELGLSAEASIEELAATRDQLTLAPWQHRSAYEAFAALIEIMNGTVDRIRLLPIDLQFDAKANDRGRPQTASPELGRRIIQTIAAKSKELGTRVDYDQALNCGEVTL